MLSQGILTPGFVLVTCGQWEAPEEQRLLPQGLRCFLYPWAPRCSPSRFSWSWQWKDSFAHSPTPVWLQLPFQGSVHCSIPLLRCPLLHQSESFLAPLLAVLWAPPPTLGSIVLFFLAVSHSIWDLGSLTKDQTLTLCMGSRESQPLGPQGSPLVPLCVLTLPSRVPPLNSQVPPLLAQAAVT